MLSCTSSLEPLPTRLLASHTYFPAESLSTFCMTKLFSLIMIFRFVVGVNCIPYNGIKREMRTNLCVLLPVSHECFRNALYVAIQIYTRCT